MEENEFFSMNEIMVRANEILAAIQSWAEVNLFSYDSIFQLVLIALLFLISYVVCSRLKPILLRALGPTTVYQKSKAVLRVLYFPALRLCLVVCSYARKNVTLPARRADLRSPCARVEMC